MSTNIQILETAAGHLEPLLEEVVFVGGATVELWITDPLAPAARATADVDVIVEISTRRDYYRFEKRVRKLGFDNDHESRVICRFQHPETELILDVMPTKASILGFENRWQAEAFAHAEEIELPAGKAIRAIPPPFLLATKLEAFEGRGKLDFYESRDFEDVVRLIDGRDELSAEVAAAPKDVRDYISRQLKKLSLSDLFDSGLEGALAAGPEARERVDEVIWPRVRALIGVAA
jgi:hypothetical protein